MMKHSIRVSLLMLRTGCLSVLVLEMGIAMALVMVVSYVGCESGRAHAHTFNLHVRVRPILVVLTGWVGRQLCILDMRASYDEVLHCPCIGLFRGCSETRLIPRTFVECTEWRKR